jgi:hypothetical protein
VGWRDCPSQSVWDLGHGYYIFGTKSPVVRITSGRMAIIDDIKVPSCNDDIIFTSSDMFLCSSPYDLKLFRLSEDQTCVCLKTFAKRGFTASSCLGSLAGSVYILRRVGLRGPERGLGEVVQIDENDLSLSTIVSTPRPQALMSANGHTYIVEVTGDVRKLTLQGECEFVGKFKSPRGFGGSVLGFQTGLLWKGNSAHSFEYMI